METALYKFLYYYYYIILLSGVTLPPEHLNACMHGKMKYRTTINETYNLIFPTNCWQVTDSKFCLYFSDSCTSFNTPVTTQYLLSLFHKADNNVQFHHPETWREILKMKKKFWLIVTLLYELSEATVIIQLIILICARALLSLNFLYSNNYHYDIINCYRNVSKC